MARTRLRSSKKREKELYKLNIIKNSHWFKQGAQNKDIQEEDEVEDADRGSQYFGSIYLHENFRSFDTMLKLMKIYDWTVREEKKTVIFRDSREKKKREREKGKWNCILFINRKTHHVYVSLVHTICNYFLIRIHTSTYTLTSQT